MLPKMYTLVLPHHISETRIAISQLKLNNFKIIQSIYIYYIIVSVLIAFSIHCNIHIHNVMHLYMNVDDIFNVQNYKCTEYTQRMKD